MARVPVGRLALIGAWRHPLIAGCLAVGALAMAADACEPAPVCQRPNSLRACERSDVTEPTR